MCLANFSSSVSGFTVQMTFLFFPLFFAQRRQTSTDELNMRSIFEENDVICVSDHRAKLCISSNDFNSFMQFIKIFSIITLITGSVIFKKFLL